MALRYRNGKWHGTFKRYGRRIERCLGPDKKEAEILLAEAERRERRAALGLEDELDQARPLEGLLAQYAQHLALTVKPRSAQDALSGIRRVLEAAGTVPGTALGLHQQFLSRAQHSLVRAGKSHRTVNKCLGFVLTFLRWAEVEGLIARAPVSKVRYLEQRGEHQKRRRHRLTHEEALRLQAAGDAQEGPCGLLLALVLGTGCRLNEALTLSWADLDREAKTLTFQARHTKNRKTRTVPVPHALLQRLAGLEVEAPTDKILRATQPQAWVWLQAAITASGIGKDHPDGKVDWHALRHSYATWLAVGGVPPLTIQSLLGHSSLQITQGYMDLSRMPWDGVLAALPA